MVCINPQIHKSILRFDKAFGIIIAMRTTLDIPDTMYRRIKTRTAQEGSTVRAITLVLYSQWLGDEPKVQTLRRSAARKRRAPSWFGSVKVDESLPHDMESIRKSIACHHGE